MRLSWLITVQNHALHLKKYYFNYYYDDDLLLMLPFHLLECLLSSFISHSDTFYTFFLTCTFLLSIASPFLPVSQSSERECDLSVIVFNVKLRHLHLLSRFEVKKPFQSLLSSCCQLEADSLLFVHLPLTHRLLSWCKAADSSSEELGKWWAEICLFMSSGGLIVLRHSSFFMTV